MLYIILTEAVTPNYMVEEELLIAVSKAVFGANHRSDLEYLQECVWLETAVTDGLNLPIANHYFSPNIHVDIIKNY
jgi:hypothetical protein